MWKDEIRKEQGYRLNPLDLISGTGRIELTDKDRLKMKERQLARKIDTLRDIRYAFGKRIGLLGSPEFMAGFPKDSADDISEVVKHLEAAFEILQDFGGVGLEIDSNSPLQG